MIIKRILNNNTIISLDQNGQEIVVKGKGIAFGKKNGEQADDGKAEKIFTLDNKETIHQYQEIIMDIPEDVIETAEEIIETIKQNTTKSINDKIYITLTDHISNLLERIAMGIQFDSSLLWNVQALYPEEHHLALKAVAIMKQRFDIKIPNDEANFIAIHIVNSEMDVEFQETVGITKTIDEIMKIIQTSFPEINVQNKKLDYARFILHVRFLLQRILQNGVIEYEKSSDMIQLLNQGYPRQAACVSKIMTVISDKYEREIENERLFLLIHVIRLTTAKESFHKQ